MWNQVARIATLCTAAWLAACSGSTEPQAAEEATSGTATPSVIGDPLHQALERAESVQDTVDAQAAELRRRVEEAER